MDAHCGCDLRGQLGAEANGFVACTATGAFREAVSAFLEKRPPHFQGR